MQKIVITPRGFCGYGLDLIGEMRRQGFLVQYNDTGLAYTREEFLRLAEDADGIIVGVEQMDREAIDRCPELKAIVKFGVGTDNIDLEYAKERGIYVGRTTGSNSRSVAEMTMALILADARNLVESVTEVRNGKWIKRTGRELAGQTLGLVGFGAIGKYVAGFARAFGMRVLVFDVAPVKADVAGTYAVEPCGFHELLAQSDVVSLHVPLLAETKDLIAEPQLKRMKRTALLVNTSRGGIVNETDLRTALREGVIRSAAFDVYSSEPPERGDELPGMNRFLLTPHVASRTEQAERNTCEISARLMVEELRRRAGCTESLENVGPGREKK